MSKGANKLLGKISDRIQDYSTRVVVLSSELARIKIKHTAKSKKYKKARKRRRRMLRELDTIIGLKHFLEEWS